MQQRTTVQQTMTIFWQHLRRYPWLAITLIVTSTAGTVIEIFVPLYYKWFFDELASSFTHPSAVMMQVLTAILVAILALKIVRWVLTRTAGVLRVRLQTLVMADLSETSFAYLMRHSYRFFSDTFTGTLVRRVSKFARSFEGVADQLEFNLWPLGLTVVGVIAVTTWRSPLLGGILTIWSVLFAVIAYVLTEWRQPYRLAAAELDSEATGALADAVTNATTAKLFSGLPYETERYHGVIHRWQQATELSWRYGEAANATLGILMMAVEFVLLFAAVRLWQRGLFTLGDFALVQAYAFRFTDKLWNLGPTMRHLYTNLADAAEMVEIFNTPHEIKDSYGAKNLIVTEGCIEFQHVDFGFHQTRRVLDKFTMTIQPGERVALVGSSGAGKSTITNLLFRFYDVDGGRILIDGQNIAEVTQDSLREAIALVPQEPILFHRTLMENIRYGRRTASDAEVIEAAHRAHCHEFISDLPLGYTTYVGERGIKLSGGERQRVAIARAILKNAPILMLDEATSSLDSESEAFIQDALKELMQGKTVIVIAHRLSTILSMDRILVVEDGCVVDQGTHIELLKKLGIYQKLWGIQAGGFIP